MRTNRMTLVALVACGALALAACESGGNRTGEARFNNGCNDLQDNDGDNLFDCQDPDCFGDPACAAELVCNDGLDNDGDTFFDCADSDCFSSPACGGGCGNGICEATESGATCPADCGGAVCGNAICEAGEDTNSCPADCAGGVCGNGVCEAGETAQSCPADCGGGTCGNGICEATETAATCPADCGGGGSCDVGDCTNCLNSQCAQTACQTEFNACFGNQACLDLNDCIAACPQGDQTCVDGCLQTFAAGETDLLNLLSCVICRQDVCFVDCDGASACGP